MQASPALPWAQGTGGTLTLQEPITQDQLLAGALKFTYHKESTDTDYVAGISFNSQANVIQIVELQAGSEQIIGYNHIIQSFSGEASSIQLLPATGGEPSTLISVEVRQPIAVEGDVQIFADPYGYAFPSGVTDQVYARINTPWGYGDGWYVEGETDFGSISCFAPDSSEPESKYSVIVWVDYASPLSDVPFTQGQFVKCESTDPYDVTEAQLEFTKPST